MSQSQKDDKLGPARRNRFFYSKSMGVAEFTMEQRYGMDQRRLINRLAIGKGILCGLDVTIADDAKHLCVAPGVALDGRGREIIVPESVTLDPWSLDRTCAGATRTRPRDQEARVAVKLCYDECLTDYVPSVACAGCETRERDEASTVVETYCLRLDDVAPAQLEAGPLVAVRTVELGKAAALPASLSPDTLAQIELALKGRRPCDVDANPCVLLGEVTLPATGKIADVDNTHREVVMSNAMLRDLVALLLAKLSSK